MIFFALSTTVALVIRVPLWQKLVVVPSAIPIALISNIARITVTGSLYALGYAKLAYLVFHDLAGWLMMPFALAVLWVECQFLSRILIEENREPVRIG